MSLGLVTEQSRTVVMTIKWCYFHMSETTSPCKVLCRPFFLKQCETDLTDLAMDTGRKTDNVSIMVTLFWPTAKMESHHGEAEKLE